MTSSKVAHRAVVTTVRVVLGVGPAVLQCKILLRSFYVIS